MSFWQALLIAAVPSVAAVIAALVAFRDLGLRRRLESSTQFLSLFSLAHGRLESGRAVGVGEQIATVHLIADFAASEKLVLNAAREGLMYLTTWQAAPVTADDLLASVGSDVAEAQRRTVAEAAARRVNLENESSALIAQAATEALRRLPVS